MRWCRGSTHRLFWRISTAPASSATAGSPWEGRAAGSPKRYMRWSTTNGLAVRLALSAGEAHDNRLAVKLLSRLKAGSMLLADRGYDADWIRALAANKGALANIPPRCNRNEPICFSPYLYRARNLVERFFNKIKHCRRVATRYDKLAANYLAFVQLASIRLWVRANESASWST